MSGDGRAAYSLSAIQQVAECNPDRIVLEMDTYLIDQNNKVIPIPAGTVAVLESDADSSSAVGTKMVSSSSREAGDVQTAASATSQPTVSMDVEPTNMPADSTSTDTSSPAPAARGTSTSCEVVEATSTDPNPSMSLSDMYVEEEEEVTMDEPRQSTMDAVIPECSNPNNSGNKLGHKGGQKKTTKGRPTSKAAADGEDVESKRQKSSTASAAVEKLSLVTSKPSPVEKQVSGSSSVSPAVSSVSASGRPQRSTPRRSAYELLHGTELKPPRRPPTSTEPDQDSPSDRASASKKQKMSKSERVGEEEQPECQEAKVASEPPTAGRGRRRQSSQVTCEASEGCEGVSQCAISDTNSCMESSYIKSSHSTGTSTATADLLQSPANEVVNSVGDTEADVVRPQENSSVEDDAKESISKSDNNRSVKKQSQSKKSTSLKAGDSIALSDATPADKTIIKKILTGKGSSGSKPSKPKGSQKLSVGSSLRKRTEDDDNGDLKVPGLPYHYFMTETNPSPSFDSDTDCSSSLVEDLACEDAEWMRSRISDLEQQVRLLREKSGGQDDKLTSRCWQDVLVEMGEVPTEDVDEKLMLNRYERKLRIIDRELDERATFLRIREGCIARRERRILEKENELGKKERELEHQRHLHGRTKLSSESAVNTNPLSTSPVDTSSASNRKEALEKEVRLELRKQQLDQQKHVLEDERKKLAAKERELENREQALVEKHEQALVDADLLHMASGFTSNAVETNRPNGRTTVEFSDDDDDDFGSNSFSTFDATSRSLSFGLDRGGQNSDSNQRDSSVLASVTLASAGRQLLDAADEDLSRVLQDKVPSTEDDNSAPKEILAKLSS